MHIQDSQRTSTAASDARGGIGRPAPLRVDAQRNLEHVLRAAREVFGELGYGAPMEDVARRARVGVGTVYRRFPSKDVLVRRIAKEETARLTEQARTALGQEDEAWSALARFLRTSAASGAGRLLPPQVLRVDGGSAGKEYRPGGDEPVRVPPQRTPLAVGAGGPSDLGIPADADHTAAHTGIQGDLQHARGRAEQRADDDGVGTLLDVVGQLVERARDAGELRHDVSVADVLLVIAASAPSLPDAGQQEAASARLLDILLEGLRSRPAGRVAGLRHHAGSDSIE
ncbi:transcriptional regulator, TetR family [Actinacidiphila yanglinensis]|uniref:Transcriptional regulator, TetR family n=1 Tax=Actinacidiphila yanglinensis TaxID=310779 RepID=A0A1H6ECR6_9ACTN|nr:helix-turn-helix domain-containing protein [Actinacidiphila yanglinensis]SEG94595.1 transcriptional regulator, TetR family [Actinacidiphila yanglinensis]